VPGGARLGSMPLRHPADVHSLGIHGPRIVFQTAQAIRVYRTDLGRAVTIHRQSGFTSNLTVDRYGVRWTVWRRAGHFSAIVGVNLPPTLGS
jgi:hypothetical protein